MATAKTAKKPIKKAAPKKTTSKAKAPRKRVAARASSKAPEMKSFRIYRDRQPFNRVAITRQTIYWIILLLVIVVMQLWILKLQIEIAELTNILLVQQMR